MKYDEPHPRQRPYRMKARAKAAEETAQRIREAALALMKQCAYDHFTVQEVADDAGVSLQTVLRRFGSKEGLVTALLESDAMGIRGQRDQVQPGNVVEAVRVLMAQYEEYGDAVMRNLNLEERLPAVRSLLDYGRTMHRDWVARTFASFLPPPDAESYNRRLALFITATDVYVWKLLRRDYGLDASETEQAIHDLLNGLITTS